MAAYLNTVIDGNKNFGGYLSVDGEKAFAIGDDMTYELAPGHHILVIYSTSNFQRSAGKFQANMYMNTSSSGAILDAMERHSALKNLGDRWEINVYVEDHQMLSLNLLSKREKLIADPLYSVTDLSDEDVAQLEKRFEEWRNTPIRSKKKMIAGLIVAFCGLVGTSNSEGDVTGILLGIGLIVLGVLLFVFGFRKKIRR